MARKKPDLNPAVTKFLDDLNHPFRNEIEQLRHYILNSNSELTENIKWNGPNYCLGNNDRITMRIQPPKQVQLIFHRGAKTLKQPDDRLISNDYGLLTWKENDRAFATFKNMADIERSKTHLANIVRDWIIAAS
jgi:hypothetical protein